MPESYDLAELNLAEDSEIIRILDRCPGIERMRFNEGEYLIEQGDRSMDTFLVIDGGYVVERSDPDSEGCQPQFMASVLSDQTTPSFVGEMAYLGGGFRTASVRSFGRTYTLCLKPEHMDTLVEEFSFFTRILCRQFTARLTEANDLLKLHHDRLVMDTEKHFLGPGNVLFQKGEKADALFQLVRGVLRCKDDESGATEPFTIDGFIEPLPYFQETIWPYTVVVETSAVVVEVSKNSKLALTRNYPDLVLNLLQT
jgi:CRP-like cAMP-binding protein